MDYEKFKALYNDNNFKKEKKIKKDVVDLFDELDEEPNTPLEHKIKTPGLDMEPEILEIPPRKEEEEMAQTKNINLVNLNGLSRKVMPTVEKIYNGENKEETPKRKWFLPWTTDESHHLQNAFVNCSVLGFITMAIGASQLFYIITHI